VGHLQQLDTLVFGQPLVWSFRYVGASYLSDVALLLLAVVPDLVQAVYMTGAAVVDLAPASREPRAGVRRASPTSTSRPRSPSQANPSRTTPDCEVSRMITERVPMASVDLYWLPLGAGGSFVRFNGRVYEAAIALRQHRDRCDLYHAALQVHLDGDRFVIEMTPAWDRPEPDRGVWPKARLPRSWCEVRRRHRERLGPAPRHGARSTRSASLGRTPTASDI